MCPYSRDEPWDFYWEIFFFLPWLVNEDLHEAHMSGLIWSRVTSLERQQPVHVRGSLFRQRCVSFSLTHSWWEILRFLCGCVCVCQIADMVVCECVKLRREFTRWHLVSCLTFPVSQGSSFKNNAEEKPPTSDNWNATKGEKKKTRSRLLVTELLPLLEIGDREGETCEWLHCACSRHISPTGLLYPSISQHSSQ